MRRAVAIGATLLAFLPTASLAHAATPSVQQPTNWVAISLFLGFVALTLAITKRAATRTRTAADFYTAGGGISGFQNGLAMAGDYCSAASFLGITAQIFNDGYDGLIYAIGFLVGWPIVLFLIAERLRNLGKYTFADVAAYRLKREPVRVMAALSTLVVVITFVNCEVTMPISQKLVGMVI